MRGLAYAGFAVLLAGWVIGWQHRAIVVDAYRTDDIDTAPSVEPLALEVPPLALDASPHAVAVRSPGARQSLGLSTITPPAPEVTGGDARLEIEVRGVPDEDLPWVVVRVERVTSAGSVVFDRAIGDDDPDPELADEANNGAGFEPAAGPDRTLRLRGLRGGRYGVRAFIPGRMASVAAVAVVVPTDGAASAVVSMAPPDPTIRLRPTGPEAVLVATTFTFGVSAWSEGVDAEGRIVELPTGNVTLVATVADSETTGGPVRLLSADTVGTDDGGAARFLLACDALGSGRLVVDDGSVARVLALPPCVETLEVEEPESTDDDPGTGGE